jgi:hypothetical protein
MVSESLFEEVSRLAKIDGVTTGQFARKAVEDYMAMLLRQRSIRATKSPKKRRDNK